MYFVSVYSSICESLNAHDGCRYGYTCLATGYTTIICVSQCSQKPGFCENRGDCYVDSRDDKLKCRLVLHTINSEIFARVLFSGNFA